MKLDIQARGFTLSEGLRHHCERRLRFALGAAGGRLGTVAVRLSDLNGQRGGVDKRCAIRAIWPGKPPIVIAQDETDIYVAIDRAAARVARTLARQLGKSAHDRHASRDAGRDVGSDPLPA